jgi:hypothetical protein
MKTTLLTTFLLIIFSLTIKSQNSDIEKLLQNDLRYWFPIGVTKDIIIQNLTEGKKKFDISDKKMSLKKPSSETFLVDKIITVKVSSNPNDTYPMVMYFINNDVCTGMMYFDKYENLPKWEDILKNSETVKDNYFVSRNFLHLVFNILPKENIISIQIDIPYFNNMP